MARTQWSSRDLKQMKAQGIDPKEASHQLELFRNPPPASSLDRPAALGDGIARLDQTQIGEALEAFEKAKNKGRFLKFVPASGAASRMFHLLLKFLQSPAADPVKLGAESQQIGSFLDAIDRTAFWPDLVEAGKEKGLDFFKPRLEDGGLGLLRTLLSEEGLDYSRKPKALIKFHRYPSGSRTPLEEHLVEAARTTMDKRRRCRIHFTVSPEHEKECRALCEEVLKKYEKAYRTKFSVDFSNQRPSTNTLAVEPDDRPIRDSQGRLLFRPAGHGALLENLNRLKGDLVFIKNIDNVVVEDKLEKSILWKSILGGRLVLAQDKIRGILKALLSRKPSSKAVEEAVAFLESELHSGMPVGFGGWTRAKKIRALKERLNRPLRVCGVVPNTGEPGGGPFWVRGEGGELSLQIVESVQVEMSREDQKAVFQRSSHFNPVDLVCGVRDYKGKPFDLRKFRDEKAVFISRKSQEGRELKALELPGLWNGAMGDWITLFVEVPLETFNPVKTVFDLLKPAHQPKV